MATCSKEDVRENVGDTRSDDLDAGFVMASVAIADKLKQTLQDDS